MHTHGNPPSDNDGYELFRRAIVERDEQAWAEGAARYRAMLIVWAKRCSASATITERADDIADQALARAWAALTPARFARIPSLAALLAYLRTCVATAVIDCARSDIQHERLLQALIGADEASPEEAVLAEIQRQEIWQIAQATAHNQQERVILKDLFVYGLRSQAILARHPTIFDSIGQVYTARRNLIERLGRNPRLRQLYDEA